MIRTGDIIDIDSNQWRVLEVNTVDLKIHRGDVTKRINWYTRIKNGKFFQRSKKIWVLEL